MMKASRYDGRLLIFFVVAFIHFFGAEAVALPVADETKDVGVLHCYCNLPECITTGYMCKTKTKGDQSGAGAGCFSDLIPFMDVDRAVHGCLDLLPKERRTECRNVPTSRKNREGNADNGGANFGKRKDTREAEEVATDRSTNPGERKYTREVDEFATSISTNHGEKRDIRIPEPTRAVNLIPPSLLLCCNQDMCNHVDSPETRNKYNQTILAVGAVVVGSGIGVEGGDWQQPPVGMNTNNNNGSSGVSTLAWLKVATVLVSICGLLVLLALVLLAVRILKSESNHTTHITTLDKFRGEQGELFLRLGGEGSCSGEKRPLGGFVFQENLTRTQPQDVHRHHLRLDHKNIANAQINSTTPALQGDETARLLLVGKSVQIGSCNLLYPSQHQAPKPLPPLLTVEKHHYKRIPPLNHNINTLQ